MPKLRIDRGPKRKKKTLPAYSGARYPNVPASLVATDFSPSGASLTNPKSETFARKSSPKRMFEDLRSRCIKVSRARL